MTPTKYLASYRKQAATSRQCLIQEKGSVGKALRIGNCERNELQLALDEDPRYNRRPDKNGMAGYDLACHHRPWELDNARQEYKSTVISLGMHVR
ncbi:hypothetical protein JMJ77_0013924 [Colletotrichum scovillei]|uniref:Uncharacterized protein n=1 Tax=Colletotrichum scovillei TaxID=1209932 RepID=A0A9P7UGY4_9PEZI|nr:hypothetical protein JMJ77_0013924 [Colletotrichum scovillei]KAG7065446.1 hypothetical protein JMJ78_0012200 [Colletotrichum scovillei]KAG7068050.1 hypothetical protein JMJ76_0007747 [Colletotrichum scovillei]